MQIVFNQSGLFFHSVFQFGNHLKSQLSLSLRYSSSPVRPVEPRGEHSEHLLLIKPVQHHQSHWGVKCSGALQTRRMLPRNTHGGGDKLKKDFR